MLLSATEAILLDVSGMKCGGCSSAVKRILMGNPEIKSAAVNLLTESAVFKVPANSDKAVLGEEAASLLTKQVQQQAKFACPMHGESAGAQ